MKTNWWPPSILVIFAIATSWPLYRQAVAPPLPAAHDFGLLKQGALASHVFTIANPLDEPLDIARVESNLPGVSARFKARIPPHGVTELSVSWDTRHVEGDMQAQVQVVFRAGHPKSTYSLHAHVRPPLEVIPGRTAYFSVYRGESAQRRIRIVSHDAAPLYVEALERQGRHFTAELVGGAEENAVEIELRVPPDVAPGRYLGGLVLTTNHPQVPGLRVGVNVFVKDELYVNPDTIDLGEISRDQLSSSPGMVALASRSLMVRRRSGQFSITSIRSDVPFVTVVPSGQGASEAFRLDVEVVPERLEPGPVRGSIFIETDDPQHPKLVLPVAGNVV